MDDTLAQPTKDLPPEPEDLLAEAQRRLQDDPLLRYRAELAAKVLARLRRGRRAFSRNVPDLEDDRLIAAIALVVAKLETPGASE